MSLSLFVRKAAGDSSPATSGKGCSGQAGHLPGLALGALLALGLSWGASAQSIYVTNGTEYSIAGGLSGDQVNASVCLTTNDGFVVWEDNITDTDGTGISAMRVDSSFSRLYEPFRVNQTATGYQQCPQAVMLKGGGAAFVWQGGQLGRQHIYARFLSPAGTWLSSGDVLVSAYTNCTQIQPAIATLVNSNVVIVWGSFNQAGSNSLQDVYAQVFSPTGQKIGAEFLVNSFTPYNQRSVGVAALAGGGFAITWVSEQQVSGVIDNIDPAYLYTISNSVPSVDVFVRRFKADGTAVAYETLVNTSSQPCSSPVIAPAADGGFMIAWSQKDMNFPMQNSWDIWARPFSSAGLGGAARIVNTRIYGDQYLPKISGIGNSFLVAWTSLGQDGSREGVYGQFLRSDGVLVGSEFRVNTTTISQQKLPTVAADGYGRFLVVWAGYSGLSGGFDLYAQRYIDSSLTLPAMNAPFVYVPLTFTVVNGTNRYQPQFQVSWPFQTGLNVDYYEVYVDGAVAPAASVRTNVWFMTGVASNSTHSFQVGYVLTDGRRSPKSEATSATTWSGKLWGNRIPNEWMVSYYGERVDYYDDEGHVIGTSWPIYTSQLGKDGPTLYQVFLTGASPLDPGTWLRTSLTASPQGYFLDWNPQPGLIYQVQTSANLRQWTNFGTARFSAGIYDSVYVGGNNTAYYRVLRLR